MPRTETEVVAAASIVRCRTKRAWGRAPAGNGSSARSPIRWRSDAGSSLLSERMGSRNIEIRGARENNLKDVSLRIPKRKITIFTGVSGSGKSSIVFDTIATEAQRQLYENFSLFIRNFLPRYPQPDADAIENLSMAVIVDQKRLGGGSHSTVGTITDIYTAAAAALLARSASRTSATRTPSRSTTRRACAPSATASGSKLGVDRRRLPRPDPSRSTKARCRCRSSRRGRAAPTRRRASSTTTRSCRKFTKEEMDLLLHGKDAQVQDDVRRQARSTSRYVGVIEKIERAYIRRDLKTLSERTQKAVAPYLTTAAVPAVQGRAAQPGGARAARSTAATSPSCRRWRSAS